MSKIELLKHFIMSPVATGSIWPSSEYLAQEITSNAGLENADFICELGPGTGALTEYIIKKKKPCSKLIAVELNAGLVDVLKDKYPELNVINDDASDLVAIAEKEGIKGFDLIISGLPWAAFPSALQKGIMQAVYSTLRKGGMFTTFAYIQGMMFPSALRYNRLLKKLFPQVIASSTVWKNIPPAFVYRCIK